MTTIQKVRGVDQHFVIMLNETPQNKELSYAAIGMLAYILSQPDDWEVMINDLRRKGAGRDKVYGIINELKEAGYITRTKYRDKAGQWVWTPYRVYGTPQPLTENPYTENPDTVLPDTDNQEILQSNDRQRKEEQKKEEQNPMTTFKLKDEVVAIFLHLTRTWRNVSTVQKDYPNVEAMLPFTDYVETKEGKSGLQIRLTQFGREKQIAYKKNHPDAEDEAKQKVQTRQQKLFTMVAVYSYGFTPDEQGKVTGIDGAIAGRISKAVGTINSLQPPVSVDEARAAFKWASGKGLTYRTEAAIKTLFMDWYKSPEHNTFKLEQVAPPQEVAAEPVTNLASQDARDKLAEQMKQTIGGFAWDTEAKLKKNKQ